MKTTIVIPHYGDRAYDLLKPCLDSIRNFTDLLDTEVIVVANGCTESTRSVFEFIPDLPFIRQEWKLLWFDEAIGYARACNEGMKVAKGDYIVLLNNDTEILESPKNAWIEMMLRAFWDQRVAISGPMMSWCPWAEYSFLIGFCIMIRKTFLDQHGLYDESFEAYGEDTDLCIRAQQAGWKIKQVPDDTIRRLEGQPSVGTGVFPIWHKGNESYRNWPGGEQLLAKNRKILHDRYATNIGKAHDLDGWISDNELRWLAARARKSKVFVQVGAWHGKSSRVIADNLPPDGKMYDIDKWTGSQAEMDTNHWSARLLDGDHAFNEYARGMWDHLQSGKVTPLKMYGKNGAALLCDMGIKADTVFIDGGHGPGETLADINSFLPLRKDGGVICGHDYMHEDGMWPDVGPEVMQVFGGNVGHGEGTSIWYTDSEPLPHKPDIYDCFIFNNEIGMAEARIRRLWNVVDRFVIVEATKTHAGIEKELEWEKHLQHMLPYLHKITYIAVNDMPEPEGTITDKSWARERHQRDAIMRGLTNCKNNDVIIISDCDEIPYPEAIQSYNGCNDIRSFEMDLFYYDGGNKAVDKWLDAKILPYGLLKQNSPCWARYQKAEPIPNGGTHYSYFGGVPQIIKKLEDTAHQEYNSDHFKNPERIRKAIEEKRDLFDREYVKFQ